MKDWEENIKKFEEKYPEKRESSDFYAQQEKYVEENAMRFSKRYAQICTEKLMCERITEIN